MQQQKTCGKQICNHNCSDELVICTNDQLNHNNTFLFQFVWTIGNWFINPAWIRLNEFLYPLTAILWLKFVCLEFFAHLETSSLPVKGWKTLTYVRHLWLLSSESSLACHTYCDTRHPLITVISDYTWHSHLIPSIWQRSCHYLF